MWVYMSSCPNLKSSKVTMLYAELTSLYAYQYAQNNTPTECNRERLILALGYDCLPAPWFWWRHDHEVVNYEHAVESIAYQGITLLKQFGLKSHVAVILQIGIVRIFSVFVHNVSFQGTTLTKQYCTWFGRIQMTRRSCINMWHKKTKWWI